MKNLITAADIKELTSVSQNTESRRLELTIGDATQRHLRPLIGTVLLAQLLAFAAAAPEPPTQPSGNTPADKQAYTTALETYATASEAWRTEHAGKLLVLWDAAKPMLAQWALVEAWPNLLVHVENAGVVIKTGNQNGTTTADAATLNQVSNAHRDTAIWRGTELLRFIESDKASYPAYSSTRPAATGQMPIGGISL